MRLVVAGGGYVGLTTATGFARLGHRVDVVEIDPYRAGLLRQGVLPFQEPSLARAFEEQVRHGGIDVHADYEGLLGHVDFAFICTSTPMTMHGSLDTTQVFAAAQMLLHSPAMPRKLVVRSTVNPGTIARLEQRLRLDEDVRFLMNPEFLREGCSLVDFETPSRIVVGASDRAAAESLMALYEFSDTPKIVTDAKTAELIKLASNAALAVRVSMANEIAHVAEWAEADVECLLQAVGYDPRIGSDYLKPGLGFGGSCLPKDLAAFRSTALQTGLTTPTFDGASLTNDKVIGRLAARVIESARLQEHSRVSIIGVGFKAGSDSLRNSQAARLVRTLLDHGFELTIYDPVAEGNARREFADLVSYAGSVDEVLQTSSVLVVLDHGLFDCMAPELSEQVVIDALGRRLSGGRALAENVTYGHR